MAKNSTALNADNSKGKSKTKQFLPFLPVRQMQTHAPQLSKTLLPVEKGTSKPALGSNRWLPKLDLMAPLNFKIHNIGKIVWKKMEILLLPHLQSQVWWHWKKTSGVCTVTIPPTSTQLISHTMTLPTFYRANFSSQPTLTKHIILSFLPRTIYICFCSFN